MIQRGGVGLRRGCCAHAGLDAQVRERLRRNFSLSRERRCGPITELSEAVKSAFGEASQNAETCICVYCGRHGILTEDHIPPKSLFPEAARSRLLKIPSCYSCNTGASKDDEYLRTMIALSAKTDRGASSDEISAAAIRSLARPEAARFLESIMRGITETFVPSPAGVLVPASIGNVDLARFDRVIARVIKGIFYDERKTRLHSDYRVVNYSTAGLTRIPATVAQQIQAQIEPLLALDPKLIGGREFVYWSHYNLGDFNESFWIIVIHRHHSFIGWTVKRAS